MLWTPKNHLIGDVTIVRVGDEYHLFTEAVAVECGDEDFAGNRVVAHAVSKDLFHWDELPPCIGCGAAGEIDAYTIYHMDVFVHDGTWYMHYTGLDIPGPGQQQTIGLATSRDGIHWTKHPRNPVLRADSQYYEPAIPREATYQEKDFGRLWFRDPCIIRDSRTGQFGMIVIARDQKQHPDVRGCLAWATSDDLIEWKAQPPIYSPGRFHTIETPSIFEHNGRHYIIFMTHPGWGSPVMATDPYQTGGDFYAISESGWAGPYVQPRDEIVVAAHDNVRMGAVRTVDGMQGERYLYGWLIMTPRSDDLQPKLTHGLVMPPPRRIQFLDDGQMRVMYNEKIEVFAKGDVLDSHTPPLTLKQFGARAIHALPINAENFIFSARVRIIRGERTGLIFRADQNGATGLYAIADCRFGRIEFGTLNNERFIDARQWQPHDEVELKIVAHGPSVEVYVDNRLMIHQVRYREQSGSLGYLVERCEAAFDQPRLMTFI